MPHAVQTTAAQHADAYEWVSEFDEGVAEDLLKNVNHGVGRALERKLDPPSTTAHNRDMKKGTLPFFAGREQDGKVLTPVFDFPQLRGTQSQPVTLHALQEWEGYVTEIKDTGFTALLTDLTAGETNPGEEADIPKDEILEEDAAKIQVGSIFRWVIGYERTAGAKKRVSYIVFRDLPVITKSDLQDGEAWAREVIRSFDR